MNIHGDTGKKQAGQSHGEEKRQDRGPEHHRDDIQQAQGRTGADRPVGEGDQSNQRGRRPENRGLACL